MHYMYKFRLLCKDGRTVYFKTPDARDKRALFYANRTGEWVGREFFCDNDWWLIGTVSPSSVA